MLTVTNLPSLTGTPFPPFVSLLADDSILKSSLRSLLGLVHLSHLKRVLWTFQGDNLCLNFTCFWFCHIHCCAGATPSSVLRSHSHGFEGTIQWYLPYSGRDQTQTSYMQNLDPNPLSFLHSPKMTVSFSSHVLGSLDKPRNLLLAV